MRSEMNDTGMEFQNSNEMLSSGEQYLAPAMEYSLPQEEIYASSCEFSDTGPNNSNENSKTTSNKTAAKKKLHEKLVRKMSYAVASSVAVVTLAQTLSSGSIQENVAHAGGSITGDVRFSIQWNDKDYNPNDFDAICLEPVGYEIYYSNSGSVSPCGGTLDVDIILPGNSVAVENIVYEDKETMEDGTYLFFVNCFSNSGGTSGFRAQIEIRGKVYDFEYNKNMETGESIAVAEITLSNGRFTINELLGQKVDYTKYFENLKDLEYSNLEYFDYSTYYENLLGPEY